MKLCNLISLVDCVLLNTLRKAFPFSCIYLLRNMKSLWTCFVKIWFIVYCKRSLSLCPFLYLSICILSLIMVFWGNNCPKEPWIMLQSMYVDNLLCWSTGGFALHFPVLERFCFYEVCQYTGYLKIFFKIAMCVK